MKEEKEFHQSYWQGKTKKQVKDSIVIAFIAILVIIVIVSVIGVINGL